MSCPLHQSPAPAPQDFRQARKTARQKLQRSESFLRSLIQTIPDSIIVIDGRGIVQSFNFAAERNFGYAPGEVIGQNVSMLLPPAYAKKCDYYLERYKKTGEKNILLSRVEAEGMRKGGEVFPVELGVSEARVDDDVYFTCLLRDITEEKTTEKTLTEYRDHLELMVEKRTRDLAASEDNFRSVVENTPDFVTVVDRDGEILYCNRTDANFRLHYNEDPSPCKDCSMQCEYYGPDDVVRANEALTRTFDSGDTQIVEIRARGDNREIVWYSSRYGPIRKNNKVTAAIVISRDITQMKQAEEILQSVNVGLEQRVEDRTKELEMANKDLESFTYSVSHDLRAPLRSIEGFAKILASDYCDALHPDAVHYLERITQNIGFMNELVDDLLEFSRTNRQTMRLQNIEPQKIVNEVADLLLQSCPERSVIVHIDDLPKCIADPALLKIVFQNLLSNAFKYTQKTTEAEILIGVKSRDSVPVYSVSDNGVGFDMRYHEKMFGVFQRLHHRDEYEGTGVGLAIVQRIISRHGGRVWAKSEPGKGATFFFTVSPEHADDQKRE